MAEIIIKKTNRTNLKRTAPGKMAISFDENGKFVVIDENNNIIEISTITQEQFDLLNQEIGNCLSQELADQLYQAIGNYLTQEQADQLYQAIGNNLTQEQADQLYQAIGNYLTQEQADQLYQPLNNDITIEKQIFKVNISQGGTVEPAVTLLENSPSLTIDSIIRNSAGSYRIVVDGAEDWTPTVNTSINSAGFFKATCFINSSKLYIDIITSPAVGSPASDNILNKAQLTVELYNI